MDTARELSSRLASLLRREQGAMADFLLALSDFDRQRLWVGMGYSSLFYYLRRELKLSSGSAFLRKTASELLQRFPEAEGPLRDGRLCLSSVCELAKVLTRENVGEVLPRFFHASKQEAKAVAAEIAPREVVPQRVVLTSLSPRAHPRPAAVPSAPATPPLVAALALGQPLRLDEVEVGRGATPVAFATPASAAATPGADPGPALLPDETAEAPRSAWVPPAPVPTAPRSTSEPLTATLHRLHATVSKEFMRKLAAAKDALSHSHPGADEAAILEAGLDLILAQTAKRKGLVKRPRTPPPAVEPAAREPSAEGLPPEEPESRHIPATVRRAVWVRDGGRCVWPTADGGVCGSTHRLQFDHRVPVAQGGRSTADNLRLTCAMHNDLSARQIFGDAWMNRYTRGKATPSSRPVPPS